MSPATGNFTRGATEKQIQYVDKIVESESGSVRKKICVPPEPCLYLLMLVHRLSLKRKDKYFFYINNAQYSIVACKKLQLTRL